MANESAIRIIIAGRSLEKAQKLANELDCDAYELDIYKNLSASLTSLKPDVVIHTCGPFQSQSYGVAEDCIKSGSHYIDLADGREFVSGISVLNSRARESGVVVLSGVSSVPCLTAALVDFYRKDFESLERLEYGITTAQKTTPGIATTEAILSYVGKPFSTLIDGNIKRIYGWQNFRIRKISPLGWRCFGNCNVPDLTLFPVLYPEVKTIRFYAGLELSFNHIGLWFLSWLVRIGLIKQLERFGSKLLKSSALLDRFGSEDSGLFMVLSGTSTEGKDKVITFELTAKNGHGALIPCIPAIILCRKIAYKEVPKAGARSCVGLISKQEYLRALSHLDICWKTKS